MPEQRLGQTRTIALSITVFTLITVTPAVARIECRDNFQVTKHGLISTPYCEEKRIARVARSYGFAVSDEEVRNNPNMAADAGVALSMRPATNIAISFMAHLNLDRPTLGSASTDIPRRSDRRA